jgi:hypothetical protein
MKTILTAAVVAAFAAGSADAATTPPAVAAPLATPPAASSVFVDLAVLGYDPGRFRPDYTGRFPYRRS